MGTTYTCGHVAVLDDNFEYINGTHALWDAYDDDGELCLAYGVLCNDCIDLYEARKCKLGGVEIDD